LVALAQSLPPRTVGILLDNPATLTALCKAGAEKHLNIFIKIDTGYHRAGITTSSQLFQPLVEKVVSEAGDALAGFYSHFGHSYAGSSGDDAAKGLLEELIGLQEAALAVPATFKRKLILSVGATPTATVAQSIASGKGAKGTEVKQVLARLNDRYQVELHAGVYPLLDLQQVATHARPETGDPEPGFQPLSKENIGFKVLVEVTSVYDERGKPEALISAGSLALGREPCKSYPGWGIVTGELGNSGAQKVYDERGERTGWIVGRISQEHGVLTWEGPREQCNPLKVGDKLFIWPNHACIAGAHFPYYLVTDSDREEDKVYDIWARWARGW
jgi:D-serine deaminase-like pyridoxal phosphate-dependent protein